MPPKLHTSVDCRSASHRILPHQPTVSCQAQHRPQSIHDLSFLFITHTRTSRQAQHHPPSIPGHFLFFFLSGTDIVTGAYKAQDTCTLFLATSSREAHYPKSSQACSFFFLSSFSSGNIIAVVYRADSLANKSLQFIIVVAGSTVLPGYLLLL
jgi:hypothetical protein